MKKSTFTNLKTDPMCGPRRNSRMNDWHPWQGITPDVAIVSRQQQRRKLIKQYGSAPGKARYRALVGLEPLIRKGESR